MIPGDQGGGGWGYQVVNIGGRGAPALPRNPQSWNSTLAKKNAQEWLAAQSGGRSRGRNIARSIARNGGRLRMWPRLTEVTSTRRSVPV